MIGIIILVVAGVRFRRRGNSWPKTILKTLGVYGIYLFLLYGGLFAAVGLQGTLFNPPTSPKDLGLTTNQSLPVVRLNVPSPTPQDSALGLLPVQPIPTLTLQEQADQSGTTTIGEDGKVINPRPRVGCDQAYPEPRTCIPPGPPYNQGCAITSERLFVVLLPDPQGLDHDRDGIGCEPISSAPPLVVAQQPLGPCDPSYPGVCIPPAPPDLSCDDVLYLWGVEDFAVYQPDSHGFDGDGDGYGCEPFGAATNENEQDRFEQQMQDDYEDWLADQEDRYPEEDYYPDYEEVDYCEAHRCVSD